MDREIILLILATAIVISTIIYFTVKEAVETSRRCDKSGRSKGKSEE